MERTSEVLNKAADIIEQRGWAGREVPSMYAWGDFGDESSPLCLEGAIFAAAGFYRGNDESQCAPYVAMQQYLHLEGAHLWTFNDDHGRTAAEVIEVLRACALIQAAREEQDAAWATYAGLVTA